MEGSFCGKRRKEVSTAGPYDSFGLFRKQGIELPLKTMCCSAKVWKAPL